MKPPLNNIRLLFIFIGLTIFLTRGKGQTIERLSPSLQGDTRYSQFNNTNITVPYKGLDSWMELRAHWWLERKHIVSPYISAIGSHMSYIRFSPCNTCMIFDWQRYIQGTAGLEFYLFNIWAKEDDSSEKKVPRFLSGVRFYSFMAIRKYFTGKDTTQTTQTDYQKSDARIGVDYYFDNIFDTKQPIHWSLWADVSGRKTNFSHPKYNVFFTTGFFRMGRSFSFGDNDRRLYAYGFSDWLYASGCPCRWWENAIKPGVGVTFFPVKTLKTNSKLIGYKRLNMYLEWIPRVVWLGDNPPIVVSAWDLRFGMSFSTSRLLGGK